MTEQSQPLTDMSLGRVNRKMMKKIGKAILIVYAAALIFLGILQIPIGISAYQDDIYHHRYAEVDAQTSPDGIYTIKLFACGRPERWYNEVATGYICLYEGERKIMEAYTSEIPYMKEPIAKENWEVAWQEDKVLIYIDMVSGETKKRIEQFEFCYDGTYPHYERLQEIWYEKFEKANIDS